MKSSVTHQFTFKKSDISLQAVRFQTVLPDSIVASLLLPLFLFVCVSRTHACARAGTCPGENRNDDDCGRKEPSVGHMVVHSITQGQW